MKNQKLEVKGTEIVIGSKKDEAYISLTDIARYKNPNEPKDVVKNWLRSRSTIEFIGLLRRRALSASFQKREQALTRLERAVQDRNLYVMTLKVEPRWDALSHRPAFYGPGAACWTRPID
ncbi:MAG TPA: KilA-N domain-containing protein [Blastocatellia bacterium]|nr:KilA-N domain-containing protein [Blastocatellia bacterium]